MMIVNFNSNTIVFQSGFDGEFVAIHQDFRIIAFCININYVAVIEDWQYISGKENLHIYDLSGNFLFNVQSAPRALSDDGFYSSIGFENEHILIAQSNDFRYKINLLSKEFVEEKYTK
jgi:hypothetical protein